MPRRGAKGCVAIAVSMLAMTCAASGKIIYVGPGQSADAEAIIIDHNCADLSVIPDEYLARAPVLRVLMRHASVGQGIDWGLDCLAGNRPTNPACSGFPASKYDRSNWVLELRGGNWQDKIDDLVTQTASRADEFDVFMTKLCYIDALGNNHPDWEYFRSRMEQLEADYPGKKFVWWTIPLTRDGQAGTDVFNALVRSYCAANGKILFDIADIECHEPNGVKLTNAAGDEVISQNYTKEIHAGHLNPDGRVRVASAFWHLMARLTGWQEQPRTIQDAIDVALHGDTIIVADGVYTGPGNRDIDFNGKSVTIRSENGPEATIIDCQGEGYGFEIVGNKSGPARIEGFTIRHGVLGGIRCYGTILVRAISPVIPEISGIEAAQFPFDYAPVVIHNCKIVENPDGGILLDSHDNVTIANCYIASNGTAGIYAYASNPTVRNCAVVKNYDAGIRAIRGGIISNCTVTENNGIGIWISQGTIVNSIVWGNGQRQLYNPDDNASVTYCDVQDGWPGQGNIDADPCFVDAGGGDYHLKSQAGRWDPASESWVQDDATSPCIDGGDPTSPIGREPFPNGGIINMGAYSGTAEASKSYFDEPVCETIVAGDINGDCKVDFADLTIMARQWLEDKNQQR